MTTASTGSAFPPSIDELVPRVRARQVELGAPLSRNRVMREFRVGKDKARAVLDALGREPDPGARPEVSPGRVLHAVSTPVAVVSEPGSDPVGEHIGVGVRPEEDDEVRVAVDPGTEITPSPVPVTGPAADPGHPTLVPDPVAGPGGSRVRQVRSWRLTLVLLALPAFVAIWGGWVGLGELTGWGPMHPLPGIADGFVINSAITLPIGVEAYAAFALRVWLSESVPVRARRFAKVSAIGSLVLGAAGQVAYHLMTAAGVTQAPWPVITLVGCLPVVVLGCAAGLAHLIREGGE